MNVIDVNVLVALFSDEHPHHDAARRWWSEATGAGDPVTVPDVVWVGFLRLVTDRRILPTPATFEEAWTFVDALTRQPSYLSWAADARVLAEFGRWCAEARATANLVTDAYIAASASSLGATVVTFDRDFRRFDGLRVHEPA